MPIRDTSLAAYASLDLTAGQRRVLGWLVEHAPARWMTRQQIADESRIPIQSVCGRVNELLHDYQDAPIEEGPAVDGAHPIRLKSTAAQVNAGANERPSENIPPQPASAAPLCESNTGGVKPYIAGRTSMTPREAVKILSHKKVGLLPEWLVAEAREVEKRGTHWRPE